MIKFILTLLILCLGCGAVADSNELGSDAEALFGATRPGGFNFGITSTASHFRCTTSGVPSQDCYIPVSQSRTLRVCLATTNLQSLYVTGASSALGSIAAQNTGWTITFYQNSFTTCDNDHTNGLNDIVVTGATNFCTGICAKTGSIDSCVCQSPFVGAVLSETLDGVYHAMYGGYIYVDTAHLALMSGVTGSDLSNIAAHGVAHDMAELMGIGAIPHAAGNSSFASDMQALDTGIAATFTAGELCQLQLYHGTFPTLYENHYSCSQ